MRKFIVIFFLVFFLNGCATGNKYGQQTCKELHGQFTKAVKCLELKFVNLNPKKNEQYKDTYSLTLKALANQVYENKINNTQAWLLYDDIIKGFGDAKDKQKFLINTLSKYN